MGIIVYELLTGSVPYTAETPLAVAHVHKPLPPPRTRNPALSEAVEGVLLKVLATAPGERYADGAALCRGLATAAARRVRERVAEPTTAGRMQRVERERVALACAGCGAALVDDWRFCSACGRARDVAAPHPTTRQEHQQAPPPAADSAEAAAAAQRAAKVADGPVTRGDRGVHAAPAGAPAAAPPRRMGRIALVGCSP